MVRARSLGICKLPHCHLWLKKSLQLFCEGASFSFFLPPIFLGPSPKNPPGTGLWSVAKKNCSPMIAKMQNVQPGMAVSIVHRPVWLGTALGAFWSPWIFMAVFDGQRPSVAWLLHPNRHLNFWGMAVQYNRYKFLRNGFLASETAAWIQKWFKTPVGTSRKHYKCNVSRRRRRARP